MPITTVLPPRPQNTHAPNAPLGSESTDRTTPPAPNIATDDREQFLLLGTLALGLFTAIGSMNWEYAERRGLWAPQAAGLLLAAALIAVAIIRGARLAPWATLAYIVQVGIIDRVMHTPVRTSDVLTATQEALDVLARGDNPYAHTYLTTTPPRSPFPYLPGELAFYAIPNALFGEIAETDRWAGVGIVLLLAALGPCVGAARAGLATGLYATFDIALDQAPAGGNDTGLAFLVVLAVVLLAWSERGGRGSRELFYASAAIFAWAVVFKDFAWLFYPFVLLYLRRRNAAWRGHAAAVTALSALSILPFFLSAPTAFVRNVFGGLFFHHDVWGLNIWSALQWVAPDFIESATPVLQVLALLTVVGVGLGLLLRPAPNLGLAVLQGTGLLFVALLVGRWTSIHYYTFAAAVLATGVALSQPTTAPPHVRSATLRWRIPKPRFAPAVPPALVLGGALIASAFAWASLIGWTSERLGFSLPKAQEISAGRQFEVTRPEVAILSDSRMDVTVTLTSDAAEQIRAWFFLSEFGSEEPAWESFGHKSAVIEQRVPADEPTRFHWSEMIDVPTGSYSLSVWFHKREGNEWIHAMGGHFGVAPLAMTRPWYVRTTPVTGPFSLAVVTEPPVLKAGQRNLLRLAASGDSPTAECRTRWQLSLSRGRPLAHGQGGACVETEVSLPTTLQPGQYTLEVTAIAVAEGASTESDRIAGASRWGSDRDTGLGPGRDPRSGVAVVQSGSHAALPHTWRTEASIMPRSTG